jgi:hypothetical protein
VRGFLDERDVRYIDGRRWLVRAEFRYYLRSPDGVEFVRADVGTITDFASIPRFCSTLTGRRVAHRA